MRHRPRVMFESWRGLYSDGPKAVSEKLRLSHPQARQLWATSRESSFPSDLTLVDRHSPAYFAQLLSADVLVTNDIVSRHLVKGPRVHYLQMWHGTPLKLIGHDERSHAYDATTHLRRMDRDVAKWDYLVSPSQTCSDIFRSAFGYDGEIWEVGYPRNDVLRSVGSAARRQVIRKRLGLADGSFALLYAPTWRDDASDGAGRFRHSAVLDPELVRTALPEGGRLLTRLHRNVSDRPATTPGGFVVDVSDEPDIADLYLAADGLVSDYSSAIYDFAVTGKPIFCFVPDLERYRDSVRGMYFTYEDWAPGPVARTAEELGAALEDLATVQRDFAERYAAFVQKFCPHEDGSASDRVVDRLRAVLGS